MPLPLSCDTTSNDCGSGMEVCEEFEDECDSLPMAAAPPPPPTMAQVPIPAPAHVHPEQLQQLLLMQLHQAMLTEQHQAALAACWCSRSCSAKRSCRPTRPPWRSCTRNSDSSRQPP